MADDTAAIPPETSPATSPEQAAGNGAKRAKFMRILAIVVVVAALIWAAWYYLTQAGRVHTDNAYVGADSAVVTALVAGPVREVRVAGTVDASGKDLGETGGRVEITGENIALTGATIDVSGDSGGGTALIGGGREGLGLDHVAKGLYVDQNSTVNADAIRSGNGGEIVLFSQNATRSFGRLQARGGVESGNGGFIETSGGWLSLKGTPDTAARALLGIDGTWLIDPLDIEIVAAAPTVDVGGGPIFTPTGGASKLWVEDLKNAFTTSSTVSLSAMARSTSAGVRVSSIPNFTKSWRIG